MSKTTRTVVIVIVTLVALLVGRGILEGRAALRRAHELDQRGETDLAIGHAMRAAKWYVPLASHPAEAYDLLRSIARKAEARGDGETALIAWQAIRAAARATRSVTTPYQDRLDEADKEIAILLASKPPPGIDRDKPRDKLFEEHRALLARDDAPKPLAVVALYAGLALWIFSVIRLGRVLDTWASATNVDRSGVLSRVALPALLAALGIAVFLFSLTRA
ncbi:MAG: hypothetical protein ACXWUG_23540 [Polyangiales bacterium]